ncbi:MAG: hypothetical protein QQW96_05135 [Tychonema bourrellyi B0820]|uniref:hypothetical protein n=1 Tax=Tychonema bourrellyi TaxID=54313 RepID=UPI0015D48483|nr:hypothetical protein [Tychonema bourrellyi]MDQ2097015.1 hypothetical protein [Tychonema bourrellyi B0820]
MGNGELGIGNWAWGIGHRASGIVGRVYIVCRYLIKYLGEPAPTIPGRIERK